MIKLIWNNKFKKNFDKYLLKHPDKKEILRIKLKLFREKPYALELRNHKLSGKLKDLRAIVIEYDCRIIFKFIDKNNVLLIDIGSHDEVY